ncbi:TonB-dependent receptor [Marinagarivorans algicola]|uniref:TonB-dependent receptor n=1 Tax=Marinagarivorans algicola TaxID=1513270 RepID=UPI0006B48BDC|nr:TonB-dependent receptor [Marinagarivorans algicola]
MLFKRNKKAQALSGVISLVALGFSVCVNAEAVTLDIAEQPLGQAINQLSEKTGTVILAPTKLIKNKAAPAIKGEYEIDEALKLLLNSTGLSYKKGDKGSFIIEVGKNNLAIKADQSEPTLETVIITGRYSGAIARAIDVKRNSASVMDSINSEDIGKFPTENVAEALQLVPGVQIERNRGEGLFVSVRGLGPEFQITQLNGSSLAINENVENSGQKGRSFRYDVLPSELISSIDVIKAPEARLEEGSIGGLVDVKTFKPIQLGHSTALSLKVSHSDFAGGTDPKVSGLKSWLNDEGTFGVLVSAAYGKRNIRQDRAFTFNWIQSQEEGDPLNGFFKPQRNRPTLERQERERVSLASSMQWQPSDNYEGTLDILWSQFSVDFDEIGLDLGFGSEIINAVTSGNTVVAGTARETGIQLSRETSKSLHDTFSIGLKNHWDNNDWHFDLNLTASRAQSNTDDPIRRNRLRTFSDLNFDYSNGFNSAPFLMTPTIDVNDETAFLGRRIEYRTIDVRDSDNGFKFEAQYDVNDIFTNIQMGFGFRDRSREYKRRDIRFSFDGSFGGDFFDDFPVSNFLADVNGDFPRRFVVPSATKFFDEFFEDSAINEPLTSDDLKRSYHVDETILSTFVQGNFGAENEDDKIFGNIGVRIVQTTQSPSGLRIINQIPTPVSFENKYTNILPSLNFNFRLSNDVLLRTGSAKVIARPALNQLTPGLSVNTDAPTAQGGEPMLNPYEAIQYDAALEWYFSDAGLLSFSVFLKDITTFISTTSESLNIAGESIVLSAPRNTGGGSIDGFEVSYQQVFDQLPEPYNGFGLQANYTYADGEVEVNEAGILRDKPIGGLSKNSFNAVAFFEQDNLSARVGYNWRDEFLLDNGVGIVSDESQAAFGTVDTNISYSITPEATVSFEVINITNKKQKTFFESHLRGGRIDHYGRRFVMGVRAKF